MLAFFTIIYATMYEKEECRQWKTTNGIQSFLRHCCSSCFLLWFCCSLRARALIFFFGGQGRKRNTKSRRTISSLNKSFISALLISPNTAFTTRPLAAACRYDSLAVNCIVKNKTGEVSSCDVPYSDDLRQFERDYLRLTTQVAESCKNHDIHDKMVIGTSAVVDTELEAAVGMYSGIFNNPFIIWGGYRSRLLKQRSRSRSSSTTHKWTVLTQAIFFLFFKKASKQPVYHRSAVLLYVWFILRIPKHIE